MPSRKIPSVLCPWPSTTLLYSAPLPQPILPLAAVHCPGDIVVRAEAMKPVPDPLPHIGRAVRKRVDALTAGHIVGPLPCIARAVGPALEAEAMSCPATPLPRVHGASAER